MDREIVIGSPAQSHFSVFEDDGFTKHSGLTGSDFNTTVYRNNVPIVLPTSIAEIGSLGEYVCTFTPTITGAYDVEVHVHYNDDIWVESFMAVSATSGQQLEDILIELSRVLGLLHYNAIVDQQTYDPNAQLTGARLRVFDSPAHVPTVPGGSEALGLLHVYTVEAEYDGLNILKKYALKRVV